jgi:carboxymethylenebutenolidase
LAAYQAEPTGRPRGAVVVLQEIFGITKHIRAVCDGYASDGYVTIAPSLFDRQERNFEIPYVGEQTARGMQIARSLNPAQTLLDVQAAIDHGLAKAPGKKPGAGLVGYCYGGTITFLAAAQCTGLACAAAYYGGQIARLAELRPRVPTILHFGDRDRSIPPEDVAKIRAAHPELPTYVYAAEHGFNCNDRAAYDAAAAKLARERTLALFREHVG